MNWKNFQEAARSPMLLEHFYSALAAASVRGLPVQDPHPWHACLKSREWQMEVQPASQLARLRNLRTGAALCLRELDMYYFLKRFVSGIPLREGVRRKDIALVLAGGGAKGAYQIGVWQAIRELGFDDLIGGVAGTSIGALNTLLFALGDLGNAVRLWDELSDPGHRRKNRARLDKLTGYFSGRLWQYGPLAPFRVLTEDMVFISQKELQHELAQAVSGRAEEINSRYDLFSTAVDITSVVNLLGQGQHGMDRRTASLPKDASYFYWKHLCAADIVKVTLASAAMPIWYDYVPFRGRYYCDGGVLDNVPVKPLYDCGYRRFVIVYLKRADSDECKAVKRQLAAYGDCKAVHITPDFDGGLAAVLDLNPEATRKRRQAGYRDGLAQIRKQIPQLI